MHAGRELEEKQGGMQVSRTQLGWGVLWMGGQQEEFAWLSWNQELADSLDRVDEGVRRC